MQSESSKNEEYSLALRPGLQWLHLGIVITALHMLSCLPLGVRKVLLIIAACKLSSWRPEKYPVISTARQLT